MTSQTTGGTGIETGGHRRPGVAQGLTIVLTGFLPIIAIVSMFPAVPAMISHFASDPSAPTKVPAMVSAPGLTVAILALFAGLMVDKFGRRRLLLLSTGLYGFIGMAPMFLQDLDQIYASRLLLGVAEAAILTTANTLIGDYWDEAGRHRWLSLQGIIGPFFGSAVIFTSGYLASMSWDSVFLIYSVGFVAFLAMFAFIYEPENDETARKMLGIGAAASTPFPWKGVLLFSVVTLFGGALYYVFIINGGIVWQELGVSDPAEIGRLTTIPSMFVIVGALIFWATGRFGPRIQLTVFLCLLGSGLAVIGSASDWKGMVAGMALQQTGAGMAVPTLIAWAQSYLPFEHRGRGMGVWTSTFFFGQFVSPLLVSVARTSAGSMQGAFVIAGLLGLVIAAVTWFIVTPRQPQLATA
ncbi:major facilitator superfamily MFS_1 [Novosphingobium aromaticivorans DSM 12444]|uniref:Major facilitator superfamily MFS_1 n=1 Tax=Novosphingobium aromaticivorans (strain ATCC 700278 / DSM 12444 / CCUG 56034 / CIP 105152 / NBRC 16084 / F199) TaxID=279238 RepID=Q2GAG5_NOVAD|nr:MFS transporter [Novosphingobium aromaticivorans]ABD25158.1 major facilitator superfamily MFS_1 [Novosphingobium aromaticivorans DSM 12444]SCX85271.1 Major Facilitator Superfamily protein [Novosphingobium aromaticivorans]